MMTSGILFGLGDVIAQSIFEKDKSYNYRRTANLFCVGSLFAAPVLHKWYGFLPGFCQRNIFSKYPKMNELSKTLISVSID